MIAEPMSLEMRKAAEKLADYAREDQPEIVRVLLFPSAEELRLLYVDTAAHPGRVGEAIAPFYFRSTPEQGIPYSSAVALVRPDDVGQRELPLGWGQWADAESI